MTFAKWTGFYTFFTYIVKISTPIYLEVATFSGLFVQIIQKWQKIVANITIAASFRIIMQTFP